MDVEEEFGVVIEQSDIAAINTLGDAIEFIKNKKA
jgi:acyl carrier protein